MQAISCSPLQVNGSVHKPVVFPGFGRFRNLLSSTFKPFLTELQQLPMKVDVSVKITSGRMLEAFVDSTFQFVNQPLLPSQSNFAPVEEIGEAVEVTCIEGEIPADFPEGAYIRNGPNARFGGRKLAHSIFGTTSQIWVEGEGMLHALYFNKDVNGNWTVSYKNKFVQSDTFKIETQRNKPTFLPNIEGDPLAILASNFLNKLRYGLLAKHYQNVSIFEHSGKIYTTTEDYLPQEVDISTLETYENWDINGWDGPFTSHPKKAPGSGELVTMGIDGQKPYCIVGVISADGEKLLHKVDVGFNRTTLIHEIGVTQNYNVILDHPLIADITRVIKGGSLISYDEEGKARIGVMPRYGDAASIKWFNVKPNCTYHILNCFEDDNEVVVRGCSARAAILPGPSWGKDKLEWFSKGFQFNPDGSLDKETGYLFYHVHEWRLNMVTGEVEERNVSGTDFSMDFPFINVDITGLKHKFGYTQVIDPIASSTSGMTKYGGLTKLSFDEHQSILPEGGQQVNTEYHKFPENIFCSGSVFVSKPGGVEEDDGWIVTFVHNEDTNVSQAYVIDAKKFESKPVAIITLPQRVPYGHHGLFVSMANQG